MHRAIFSASVKKYNKKYNFEENWQTASDYSISQIISDSNIGISMSKALSRQPSKKYVLKYLLGKTNKALKREPLEFVPHLYPKSA
ncbi:hypothetical protein QUB80_15120 [Chlorogloeopsis sp. ULAP01]|nr:hypothetical protein [Chlorogloeopsis sp. ULAP01]